jgi:hypothetical protein
VTAGQVPVSTSKPVRALASVAAGTVVLSTGLPILTPDRFDWIGGAVGLLGLVITAGLAKWTEGQTTPWADVSSKVDPATGTQYAGPAAPGAIAVGEVVDVTSAEPTPYSPRFEDPATERRYRDPMDEV